VGEAGEKPDRVSAGAKKTKEKRGEKEKRDAISYKETNQKTTGGKRKRPGGTRRTDLKNAEKQDQTSKRE